jgi:hypothetical protein
MDQISSVNVWIFQANPKVYNIISQLTDINIGGIIHWEVNQNKNFIKNGHTGIIWLSGINAGIYALASVISDPVMIVEPLEDRQYRMDPDVNNEAHLRVQLKITRVLIGNPLLRSEIKQTTGLTKMRILRFANSTNFGVSPDEWQIILQMLKNH